MPRKKHTSKEIEAVIQELEELGWDLIEGKGHACPPLEFFGRDGCGVETTIAQVVT